jgi:hypothetical protein
MAVFMAAMALQSCKCKGFHFYEDHDSNNPAILAPNTFVVATNIIQVKSNGAMCIGGATSVVCLIILMVLIAFAYGRGSR